MRGQPEAMLLEHSTLHGCNTWHSSTVFHQRVDLGQLVGLQTTAFSCGFADRFQERFVDLETFSHARRMGDDFLRRLQGNEGIAAEEALFEAILAIELAVRFTMGRLDTVDFDKAMSHESGRIVDFIWQSSSPRVSREAARLGVLGVNELLVHSRGASSASRKNFDAEFAALQKHARRRQWSLRTANLAAAAQERGIPCEPMGDEYLLLGQGAVQQVIPAASSGADGPSPQADATALSPQRERLLESVLPANMRARIPVAFIAGQRGTDRIARDLEWLVRPSGRSVGVSTSKQTSIGGEPVNPWSARRSDSIRHLLLDPRVDMLVAAMSPQKIANRGLHLDGCSVAAITDRQLVGDDKETRGIEVVIRATTGPVVVGVDNALANPAIRQLRTERLILVSSRSDDVFTRQHLNAGGLVVRDSGEHLELHHAGNSLLTIPWPPGRSAAGSRYGRRRRTRMFAVGLAVALEVPLEQIASAAKKRPWLR